MRVKTGSSRHNLKSRMKVKHVPSKEQQHHVPSLLPPSLSLPSAKHGILRVWEIDCSVDKMLCKLENLEVGSLASMQKARHSNMWDYNSSAGETKAEEGLWGLPASQILS